MTSEIVDYKIQRNNFPFAKKVSWADVIHKLDYEFRQNTHKMIMNDETSCPTFVMHSDYFPNTIGYIHTQVCEILQLEMCMHLYTSFTSYSNTFGRHNDNEDVLIIQSIGRMQYSFDDGNACILNPGDSLLIKKGVYHNPKTIEPRATLSYSWVH